MTTLITMTILTMLVQAFAWHLIKTFVRRYKVKKRSASWFMKEVNLSRDFWAAFAPLYLVTIFVSAVPGGGQELVTLKLIFGVVALLITVFFGSTIVGHLRNLSLRHH